MNDTFAFDLLEIIKTREDKIQFLSQLENLSQSFFSHEKNVADILEKNLPYGKKEKLLQIAKKNSIDFADEKTFEAFLQKIKNEVTQMPEVMITLAFWPPEETISAVSSWFAVESKKAVILDIAVERAIMGGAIIGYHGMYKDFSLRKKLKDKYEKGEIKLFNSGI